MATGEYLAYGSLPVDSKVKFAAWSMRWRPSGADPTFIQMIQVNSRNGFAIDDSTINIDLVLLFLLLHAPIYLVMST